MNDEIVLRQLLAAVEDAAAIVRRGRLEFESDPLLQRAAKNVVTEIGEAAKLLDVSVTATIPGVNWRAAAGMRDVTVHRYWAVITDLLWDTLCHDLPPIGQSVRSYLES